MVPGLPARRLAAVLIDEVLKARLALDETFERLAPEYKLDAADAGLARAIAITAFRRLGTIQHAINARLERGSPDDARAELIARGVGASRVQRVEDGEFREGRGGDWNAFVFFADPAGNAWVIQERPSLH